MVLRLEQRRQEEEARQKALQEQNERAAAANAARRAEEDDEPPGPLPNKSHPISHSRASRTRDKADKDTNQAFHRSELFGLPPSAPTASPTASPVPWESVPHQTSGASFRSSRPQAVHHPPVNLAAAGTGGLQQAPMGDMLQLGGAGWAMLGCFWDSFWRLQILPIFYDLPFLSMKHKEPAQNQASSRLQI